MFYRVTLFAMLSMFALASEGAQNVSFPAVAKEAKSPNGRYAIRNTDSDGHEPAHTLALVEETNVTTVYSYERLVDVLWSPASDGLVINDYEGSDSARPLLFALPWNGSKKDLLEQLESFLQKRKEQEIVTGNDHVYLTVCRSVNRNELLCKLEGYGGANRNGLNKHYIYAIGRGFRVARQSTK